MDIKPEKFVAMLGTVPIASPPRGWIDCFLQDRCTGQREAGQASRASQATDHDCFDEKRLDFAASVRLLRLGRSDQRRWFLRPKSLGKNHCFSWWSEGLHSHVGFRNVF